MINPILFYVEGEMPGGQKAGRLEYVESNFERFHSLINAIRNHENHAWPVTKYTGYFRPGDLYGKDHGHDIVKEFDKLHVPYVDPGIYKITSMVKIVAMPGGIVNYSNVSPEQHYKDIKEYMEKFL